MRITTRALITNTKNKTLLVQHHGSRFWSLPGGKVEGSEDMKAGLQREIFEELGTECTVGDLRFVHEFRWSPESDVTVEFFFDVKLHDEKTLQGEHTIAELKKIDWIEIQESTDIKPEFLQTALTQSKKPGTQYFSYL